DLNVYPVPDGDTGTNLLLTVRGIAETLAKSTTTNRDALAAEVSRAALMSARGNSGVILSQIVRGAAEKLASAREIDAAAIARAPPGSWSSCVGSRRPSRARSFPRHLPPSRFRPQRCTGSSRAFATARPS